MTKDNVVPLETKQLVRKQQLQSFLAVSFYMSVSIALVFLNKTIMSNSKEKAGAFFVSWYQFIVAYVLILIITTLCPNVPLLNLFPPLHYQKEIFIKVIPVSISYLLMIGFNNKCLEFVSVSGYQIVRSLTIIFSIILTYIFQKQTTSFRATLACLGVIIGFCMGVKGDLNLTLKGCIYGISSSFFVALYSIMVKRVMGLLDNNEYLLIEYNTPLAIIMLTPVVWYNGEFNVLKERRSLNFWGMQTLAGVVGFIINIAIFLNIKYTTPLTHNLSGTVKACIQTLLAFVFFPKQESMTTQKFIGTVLVIGFSAYYTFVRKAEMKQKIEQEHIKKMEENDQTALLGQDEEKDEEEEEDGNEKPLL